MQTDRPQATRVVVTGGAGFLGSHLCERLLNSGHQVVALDNLSTGSGEKVRALVGRRGFRLVAHDVRTPYDIPCDEIYNLACPASPPQYQRDPVGTTLTSVLGAWHALCLAERVGARVLQASTSEVYGDPDVHPQSEDYKGNVNPVGPRACYDEGKRCAESLLMDFHRTRGVSCRIARIFNTYGPRMSVDDGRVISNFAVQALLGHDITVFGDGSQTRSFCYVDDTVTGLVRLMKHQSDLGPVNLGNPAEHTILELAEHVVRLTGGRSRIVRRDLPLDDPRRRRPDISLARKCLGFEPTVGLCEGLVRTVESFRLSLSCERGQGAATLSD